MSQPVVGRLSAWMRPFPDSDHAVRDPMAAPPSLLDVPISTSGLRSGISDTDTWRSGQRSSVDALERRGGRVLS